MRQFIRLHESVVTLATTGDSAPVIVGHLGTDAWSTCEATSLYSVLALERVKHKAVRELYEPQSAQEVARRLLAFLGEREA